MIQKLTDFMNDNDRGPGHGIMQGAIYGFVILFIVKLFGLFLPPFVAWIIFGVLCLANHARVFYQEWIIEDWGNRDRTGKGDFWFDILFRPLQADVVGLMGILQSWVWLIIVPVILLIGYKRKNDWPFLIFWK